MERNKKILLSIVFALIAIFFAVSACCADSMAVGIIYICLAVMSCFAWYIILFDDNKPAMR